MGRVVVNTKDLLTSDHRSLEDAHATRRTDIPVRPRLLITRSTKPRHVQSLANRLNFSGDVTTL